jgi:membrane-associated phospholipid phosphatase
LKNLRAEEKIAFTFSAVIILLQLYFSINESRENLITVIYPVIFLLVFSVIIIYEQKTSSSILSFLRLYLHIPYYGIIFTSFQSFVHKLSPYDYDKFLLELDYIFFGNDLTVLCEKIISPWLTEILTIAYFSYYILPTLTFIVLYYSVKDNMSDYPRKYILSVVTGWYFAFIFYTALPAAGPDIAFPEHYKIQLSGLSYFSDFYLENLGRYLKESNVRNTFPSMHFAIILITNYFAFKLRRNYFWVCTLPFGTLLAFATIYLRQHYLIDLVAAVPLAVVCIWIGLRSPNAGNVLRYPDRQGSGV